jgi:hypothetical protein
MEVESQGNIAVVYSPLIYLKICSLLLQKTGKWNAMHVRIAWEIYNHQQKAKAESRLPGAVAGPPPHPRTGFDPLGAGASRTGFDPLGAGASRTGFDPLGAGAKPPGAADYKRPDLLYGGGGPLGRLGGPPAPNPFEPVRSPYGAAVAARGFYGPSPLGMFAISTCIQTTFSKLIQILCFVGTP